MPVPAEEQVMQAIRLRLNDITITPLFIIEDESPEFGEYPYLHLEQGTLEVDAEHAPNSTRVTMDVTITVADAVNPPNLLRTRINELTAEVRRVLESDIKLGGLAHLTWLRNGVGDIGSQEGGPRQIVYTSEWLADFNVVFGDPYTIGDG